MTAHQVRVTASEPGHSIPAYWHQHTDDLGIVYQAIFPVHGVDFYAWTSADDEEEVRRRLVELADHVIDEAIGAVVDEAMVLMGFRHG